MSTTKPPTPVKKGTRKHSCINDLIKDIKISDSKIALVEIDCQLFSVRTGSQLTGQRVTIIYNPSKPNGNGKVKKTFITHNYCPFCGKQY